MIGRNLGLVVDGVVADPDEGRRFDEHKDTEDMPEAVAAAPAAPAAAARAGPVPALEPISIYRRGHPLPHDLRARVMLYLQQGVSKQAVAHRLSISCSSVLRYQKASIAQNIAVPMVRPRGGYRSAIALLNPTGATTR